MLLTGLWAAGVACATPPPAREEPSVEATAPIEDAGPHYYHEDEVDTPARALTPIQPVYPAHLRSLGLEGDVEARVVVLADGSVGRAQLVASSDEAFTAAVREALRDARFHPAQRRGRPVASWVTLRLHFRLED